ncbi:hypothetical protein HK100_008305, partial [Physocladia obscura]
MVPPSIQSRMHELPSIPWVRRFFVLTEKCLYMFLSSAPDEYVVDQFLFAADFHSGLTATMDLSEISFALAKSDAKGVRQSWILQALTKSSKIMWFESIKSLIDAEQNMAQPPNRFTPTDNNNSSGNSRFIPPRKSSATGYANSEDAYRNSPTTLLDRNMEFKLKDPDVLSFEDGDSFYQIGLPPSLQSQTQQARQIPYAKWSAAPSIVSDMTLSSSYMATKLEDAYETFRGGAKVFPLPPGSSAQQQHLPIVAKTTKAAVASTNVIAANAANTGNTASAAAVAARERSKSPPRAVLPHSNSVTEMASKRKGSVQ